MPQAATMKTTVSEEKDDEAKTEHSNEPLLASPGGLAEALDKDATISGKSPPTATAGVPNSSGMPTQTLWARKLKAWMPKPPSTPDEHLKAALLIAHMTVLPQARARELNGLVESFIGSEHIKRLVIDGHSPEALEFMPLAETMEPEIERSIVSSEGLALGFAVAQIGQQLQAAAERVALARRENGQNTSVSAADGTDEDIVQAQTENLHAFFKRLESRPPEEKVPLAATDYSSLIRFIEAEKENGSLVGDPAWEDVKGSKKKHALLTWQKRLQKSLDTIRHRAEKVIEKSPSLVTPPDEGLIGAVPDDVLRQCILEHYETSGIRLPLVATSERGVVGMVLDLKRFCNLAIDVRSSLVVATKQVGNVYFGQGNLKEADKCYVRGILSGTNDPAFYINKAAVHLRQSDRRTGQQEASTWALQGLAMIELIPTSCVVDSKGKAVAGVVENAKKRNVKAISLPFGMGPHTAGAAAVNKTLNAETRPFKCSAQHLMDLEWKGRIRRAQALRGYADIVAQDMDVLKRDVKGHGKTKDSQSYELMTAMIYEKKCEQSFCLSSAKVEYEMAIEIDPNHMLPRLELERLEMEFDVDDLALSGPPPSPFLSMYGAAFPPATHFPYS